MNWLKRWLRKAAKPPAPPTGTPTPPAAPQTSQTLPSAASPPPPPAGTTEPVAPPATPAAVTAPPPGVNPAAAAPAPWRMRPVFISSTFRDMQAERDHLRHHVFPRLEEQLREHRHHLEPIDLRQGVETADAATEVARELLVLKVCLEEIKRSRPYLIVLLGDRYGWVPPQDRMATAAQEAGFQTDLSGKSVTALEIEFGILQEDPAQRRRSFFFFREPLPCADPDYNDACSPDPQVRARHDQLEALKRRLAADPELGPRVHRYRAGWDPQRQRVTGLEAWGDQVFELLWKELEEETRAFATQPPPTWEEAERQALEEFVEHRTRGFVGREDLTRHLLAVAQSPIPSTDSLTTGPLTTGDTWAACVTGPPGSGKSALFAHLFRELSGPAPDPQSPPLLLAHAAGISTRSASVDALLRRWIQELADSLQITNPLPEKASAEEVESTFATLLRRAAQQRRVVVLLDALNQFEPTVRARYLTWLKPASWPPNARLIATALPGEPAEALCRWAGVEKLELPPLTATDAEQIAVRVWQRYHRQFNREVFRVLAGKRLGDGSPAAGNPLWLNLALEQLNLLDADDFARAEHEFAGGVGERLRGLVLDVAQRLPAEVEGLFDWMLERTEKVHGVGWTRGFATAIALSRSGWRESDLLALVPRLAELLDSLSRRTGVAMSKTTPLEMKMPGRALTLPSPVRRERVAEGRVRGILTVEGQGEGSVPDFDSLRLAALRRAFRGQAVKRGALGQLDFFHAQMREAVRRRCVAGDGLRRQLHGALADHLLGLAETDALRAGETMYHLMEADDRTRAARYYAGLKVPLGVPNPATQTLATRILAATDAGASAAVDWTTSLLAQPGLELAQVAALANRFQFDLNDALENEGRLGPRRRVLEATRAAGERLAAADPSNAGWQRDLSVSHDRLGDVLSAQGDLAGARAAYRESLAVRQRLAAADPSNAGWQRDLWVSCWRMALMAEQSSTGDAHQWWRKAYDTLSAMKQRGIMLPTDEQFLEQLRQKVGEG